MFMNLPLLYLSVPVIFLCFLSFTWLVQCVYRMSDVERRVVWGGLYMQKPFYIWCCTFLLSSFGCTSSFVLYATLEPPEVFSILIFVCMNVSYMAFHFGLLREIKQLVLQSLDINVAILLALFVYTLLVFRVDRSASNEALIVGTHVCNAAAIFHVLVMERVVWYGGWVLRMQDNYIEEFI